MTKTLRSKILKTALIPLILLSLLMNTIAAAARPTDSEDSSYFSAKSSLYNQDLALMLATLSEAAYNQADIKEALKNQGFDPESIETHNYSSSEKTDNKVGFAFAHKRISEAGSAYNLISITVRGTVANEWYSNFNIGLDTNDHAGFKAAENELLAAFNKYANDYDLTRRAENKIIITGHSRGAAVANLLAADLTKTRQHASKNNIYAYTFATPNTSKSAEVKNTQAYTNIFNFVNAEDFITHLPLSADDWNYGRYGITLTNNSSKTVQDAIDMLLELAPNTEVFYHTKYPSKPLSTDLTPQKYFEYVCDVLSRSSSAVPSALVLSVLATNTYYGGISKFLLKEIENIRSTHTMPAYRAWITSTPYEDFIKQ
ncbi:MAG: lipase family protein [Peptococcaceae bacterium]|nr:lipase family protein [Peptococcaceae bacterium]